MKQIESSEVVQQSPILILQMMVTNKTNIESAKNTININNNLNFCRKACVICQIDKNKQWKESLSKHAIEMFGKFPKIS